MQWIPLPAKQGYGYQLMMSQRGEIKYLGPAIYGCFVAIVGQAAKCGDPEKPPGSCVYTAPSRENPAPRCEAGRGVLLRSGGMPHTAESLSVVTQIDKDLIRLTLDFASGTGDYAGNGMDWIEILEFDEKAPFSSVPAPKNATLPQGGAGIPQEGAVRARAREQDITGSNPSQKDKRNTNTGGVDVERLKKIFDNARKKYPGDARGLETEWKAFTALSTVPDWRFVIPYLVPAIEWQMIRKKSKGDQKQFTPAWPEFSKFLAQRKWEVGLTRAVQEWNEKHSARPEFQLPLPEETA